MSVFPNRTPFGKAVVSQWFPSNPLNLFGFSNVYWGLPGNPLKAKLLAGDLRTAQVCKGGTVKSLGPTRAPTRMAHEACVGKSGGVKYMGPSRVTSPQQDLVATKTSHVLKNNLGR